MTTTTLKQVKKGEFFRLSDKPNAKTYIREEYDRETKKFYVTDCEDIFGAGRMLKGSRVVYIDFEY